MTNTQEHMHKTRFPELNYTKDGPGLWRFVCAESGKRVGPQYESRKKLLQDLNRYAYMYGCSSKRDHEETSTQDKVHAPYTRSDINDAMPFRAWMHAPSHDEDPRPWKCIAAFYFPSSCLEFIATMQDSGNSCIFQSPAKCEIITPSDPRAVYKTAQEN